MNHRSGISDLDVRKLLKERNAAIKHINPVIPSFEVPVLDGEYYADTVPDTLDLAERARLAVRGMTEMTDPQANYELYWTAFLGSDPPLMLHDFSDQVEYKFFGPTSLLRTVCGSRENMGVDWHRMATLRQLQAPDGLLYETTIGRPWATDFGAGGAPYKTKLGDYYILVAMTGRQVEAALVYWKLTGDDAWRELARGAVVRAKELLVDRGDHGYYLGTGVLEPGMGPQEGPMPPLETNHVGAWTGWGAAILYRMTGFEPALDLAVKLAKFFVRHSGLVEADGAFGATNSPDGRKHFHSNTMVRMLLLDAGLISGDREMVELAKAGYDYGKKYGDVVMGFFAENLFAGKAPGETGTCELCEVADMIYLALRQSQAGVEDCWDDIDRWVRNMFTEAQIRDVGWVRQYTKLHGEPVEHEYATTDRVPERTLGVWAGWVAPNQLQVYHAKTVQNCCTGNCAAQLYRVWREMARFDDKENLFRVNLLLNKASREADVYSWLPNRGQVEVKVKRDCRVAVRIPEWVKPAQCVFSVSGKPVQAAWEGRYGIVPAVAGQTVSLGFPISERTEVRYIMGQDWKLTIRGNTIVDIVPEGPCVGKTKTAFRDVKINPKGQFGRMHYHPEYRTNEAKMVTRERYIHPHIKELY